jgi:hypothetical protein
MLHLLGHADCCFALSALDVHMLPTKAGLSHAGRWHPGQYQAFLRTLFKASALF